MGYHLFFSLQCAILKMTLLQHESSSRKPKQPQQQQQSLTMMRNGVFTNPAAIGGNGVADQAHGKRRPSRRDGSDNQDLSRRTPSKGRRPSRSDTISSKVRESRSNKLWLVIVKRSLTKLQRSKNSIILKVDYVPLVCRLLDVTKHRSQTTRTTCHSMKPGPTDICPTIQVAAAQTQGCNTHGDNQPINRKIR